MHKYLFILLCLIAVDMNSQDLSIGEISKLPKDSIVALAAEQIRQRLADDEIEGFNVENYDQIRVWADDKTLLVELKQSIVYVPWNTVVIYDLMYEFSSKHFSYSEAINTLEGKEIKAGLYLLKTEYLEIFRSVLKQNPNPEENEQIKLIENPDFWKLEELTPDYFSYTKIDRATGKVLYEFGEELAEQEGDLVEIKE